MPKKLSSIFFSLDYACSDYTFLTKIIRVRVALLFEQKYQYLDLIGAQWQIIGLRSKR